MGCTGAESCMMLSESLLTRVRRVQGLRLQRWECFLVYAPWLPVMYLVFLGSWSSRMRSSDMRLCARCAFLAERAGRLGKFSSMLCHVWFFFFCIVSNFLRCFSRAFLLISWVMSPRVISMIFLATSHFLLRPGTSM